MTAIIIATILLIIGAVVYHFGYVRGMRDLENEIDEGIKRLNQKKKWDEEE